MRERKPCSLEQRSRAGEACLRHSRGAISRLRRPARMHALGPGAFGQVFDDARSHAACDAERVAPLRRVETQGRAHAGGGAQRAEHRRGMESRHMHTLRCHQAKAAHDFAAHSGATREVAAGQAMMLRGGKQGRNDHRSRVWARPRKVSS
jgi:hypothetical protein